jgi:hypothetical protein
VVINSFPSERMLVLRERAAGTYYASAYFMAKTTSDTLVQLPIPVIFSAIVYFMIGLQPSASHFFVFAGFMVLCNLAGAWVVSLGRLWRGCTFAGVRHLVEAHVLAAWQALL